MRRQAERAALAIGAAVLLAIFACSPAAATTPMFKRGATLVEFFEFPKTVGEEPARSYADPAFPHPLAALPLFDFDELRQLGFDHMRVPLDLGPLMSGGEQQRHLIIDQLADLVAAINRHGLAVLITLLPPSLHHELPETYLDGVDGPKFRAYSAAVEQVAAALASVNPGAVALEPTNEPQDKCRVWFGNDWTSYQEILVARIRRIAPQLPLFLTGGCWSDIDGIVLLNSDLICDPRNFISVHFYRPFLFTHQGAWWSMPYVRGTIGVPYPAVAGTLNHTLELTRARFNALAQNADFDPFSAEREAEKEIGKYFADSQGPVQIEQWMNKLADWQRRQGVASGHIVFTEFGAMKQTIGSLEVDRESRARWLHDTSSAIANRGWGWTVYVLRDEPFGIYAHAGDRSPDPRLLRALQLGVTRESVVQPDH